MNMQAREIEPDLGPLLEMTEDLPDRDGSGNEKTEPRLKADGRKKPGLSLGPTDRIGQADAQSYGRPLPGSATETESASVAIGAWGSLWRATVIGVVSGTIGGVVGAFTLVWLTGAGWSVFAKLLVDAIGQL